MKSRILAVAAISAALAIGLSSPALAAEAYTGALSANSSASGGTVEYTSDNTGEAPGTTGNFSLAAQSSRAAGVSISTAANVAQTVTVGEKSSLRFAVSIPKDAKVGSVYNLTVSVGAFSDHKTITVVGATASEGIVASNFSVLWVALAVFLAALLALFVALRVRSNKASV